MLEWHLDLFHWLLIYQTCRQTTNSSQRQRHFTLIPSPKILCRGGRREKETGVVAASESASAFRQQRGARNRLPRPLAAPAPSDNAHVAATDSGQPQCGHTGPAAAAADGPAGGRLPNPTSTMQTCVASCREQQQAAPGSMVNSQHDETYSMDTFAISAYVQPVQGGHFRTEFARCHLRA